MRLLTPTPEAPIPEMPVDAGAPLLERIRGEYFEMPGLSLTHTQAARLWGLDLHTCEAALGNLVAMGFLRHTARGTYLRTEAALTSSLA